MRIRWETRKQQHKGRQGYKIKLKWQEILTVESDDTQRQRLFKRCNLDLTRIVVTSIGITGRVAESTVRSLERVRKVEL